MRLSWKGYPQGAVHGVREPVRRLVSRVCIRLWMTAVGDVLKTPIIEVSPRTVRVRRERVWVDTRSLIPYPAVQVKPTGVPSWQRRNSLKGDTSRATAGSSLATRAGCSRSRPYTSGAAATPLSKRAQQLQPWPRRQRVSQTI